VIVDQVVDIEIIQFESGPEIKGFDRLCKEAAIETLERAVLFSARKPAKKSDGADSLGPFKRDAVLPLCNQIIDPLAQQTEFIAEKVVLALCVGAIEYASEHRRSIVLVPCVAGVAIQQEGEERVEALPSGTFDIVAKKPCFLVVQGMKKDVGAGSTHDDSPGFITNRKCVFSAERVGE